MIDFKQFAAELATLADAEALLERIYAHVRPDTATIHLPPELHRDLQIFMGDNPDE